MQARRKRPLHRRKQQKVAGRGDKQRLTNGRAGITHSWKVEITKNREEKYGIRWTSPVWLLMANACAVMFYYVQLIRCILVAGLSCHKGSAMTGQCDHLSIASAQNLYADGRDRLSSFADRQYRCISERADLRELCMSENMCQS